jgi:hypothetical protein
MQNRSFITDEEIDKALPRQFLSKIAFEPNSGCWLWEGAQNTTGYANFWFEKRSHTAHRFLYERLFGPQLGLEIDHLCRMRCCVNPDHLEPVTTEENQRRRIGLGAANRKKTTCRKGHELAGDNLEVLTLPGGGKKRRCIICRNANQRAYNARVSSR